MRVALNNDLLWHLHDLWPELDAARAARCSRRSGRRGSLGAWRAPSRPHGSGSPATSCATCASSPTPIDALEAEIADLVAQVAPQLLAEPGFGPLTAGKLIGEIAGADRFSSDAKLARAGGIAPIPVSSGKTNRHRLDRGGNRQINTAIHRIAVTRARCHPETKAYIDRKRAEGKTTTKPSAASNATSPAASGTSSNRPTRSEEHRHHHQFLDIGAAKAALRRSAEDARIGLDVHLPLSPTLERSRFRHSWSSCTRVLRPSR